MVLSLSKGTVQRWVFTSHIVAELHSDIKGGLAIKKKSKKPKALQKSRIYLSVNVSVEDKRVCSCT